MLALDRSDSLSSQGSQCQFTVSESYPEAVRLFLHSSVADREEKLVSRVESSLECFSKLPDGTQRILTIKNSPDLIAEPSLENPESLAFRKEVMKLFKEIIAIQTEIEKSSLYSSHVLDQQLEMHRGCHPQDAWVIGGKSLDDPPILSIGDTLVRRLLARPTIDHVWTTSRSTQEPTNKHTHFSTDLNSISVEEFHRHMHVISAKRRQSRPTKPLTVYFVFGNTGNNSETDGGGNFLNMSAPLTTLAFLTAAEEAGWIHDTTVRFVLASSFHCSAGRTLYNDRLPIPPFEGLNSIQLNRNKAAAGLMEYTSLKFVQCLLFATALSTCSDKQKHYLDEISFALGFREKLKQCPMKEYDAANLWILSNCVEEIKRLDLLMDKFFEDTSGEKSLVRSTELVLRLEVVKIPFVLTTMIASRAPRISVKTGVKSLNDVWNRTKGRLGWAITPETAAAWLEHAASRMDMARPHSVLVNKTNSSRAH